MSDHVFICYAREDEQFALTLARKLKERQVSVWMDRLNLRPGEDWDLAIDKALYGCARFLIVLSPAAVESREVRGELRTALDENKPIVPVIRQACQIPRQLRTIQHIDVSSSGLDDETHITQLIEVLGDGQLATPSLLVTSVDVAAPQAQEEPHQSDILQPLQDPAPSAILTPTFRNSIGMDFVLIPAGKLYMGSENGEEHEKPVHRVYISRPFYLGKYQVTQGQWEAVMGSNPSHFTGDPNRPVKNVSWNDTQEFLQRLGEKEKGYLYRLPTEAEWEYAARAGKWTEYCFGDDPQLLRKYAWYDENSGGTTHPVGQLKPNVWGLYDMHGNVWEWVQDWFEEMYYQKSSTDDPQGPADGQFRVLRGGSYLDDARLARCAYRSRDFPDLVLDHYGFRVVVLPKL
jgi:formylglycine-generating enzyme required for sulfatase activity